jgi:hypothetical protein
VRRREQRARLRHTQLYAGATHTATHVSARSVRREMHTRTQPRAQRTHTHGTHPWKAPRRAQRRRPSSPPGPGSA